MLGHSACKAHGSSLALIARSPQAHALAASLSALMIHQRIKLGSMYAVWDCGRNKRHGLASWCKDSKLCR